MAWYDVLVKTYDNIMNTSVIDVINPFSDAHTIKSPTVGDTVDPASFSDASISKKISDAGLNNLLLSPFTYTTMINPDGSFSKAPAVLNTAGKINDTIDKTAGNAANAVSSSVGTIALVGGFLFLALEMSKNSGIVRIVK